MLTKKSRYEEVQRLINKAKSPRYRKYNTFEEMVDQHCSTCLRFSGGCSILSVVRENQEERKTFKVKKKFNKPYQCTGWRQK